jgi:polysulfide reductase-like protein
LSASNGSAPEGATTAYHGQPVIKEPIWTWEIPCYFYSGGLAGASAGLAYLAEVRGNRVLARRAWAASLAAGAVSPLLLSSDLGKPLRALNMFRMFKITSPMSVGSWILLASGNAIGISAANAWLGIFPRLAKVARPAAALLGLPLSTYTGALVANTAVPVWHEARRDLPLVFGSGAALSAGAVAMALTPLSDAAPARRLALAGAILETTAKELMEQRLGKHGEPYKRGQAAIFSNVARGCIAAGGALAAIRGRKSRAGAIVAGVLLSAGAISARWSVFKAGFQSAADPKYVVGPQRDAIDRGQRKGAARGATQVGGVDRVKGSPATAVLRSR